MSITKFKFVSPGVYINEIDNSQLPRISDCLLYTSDAADE